jgi:Ser/Thr protein kinase RdoA (MazF antagonist)
VATDQQIRSVLRTQWHQTVHDCTPLSDGRWRIAAAGHELLVTLTPAAAQARLLAGLEVAEHLAHVGFPAGEPVRAADGAFTVPVEGGVLAVIRDVPGRPLDPADPVDQQWWGDLLGSAHRALTGFHHPRVPRLGWRSGETMAEALADVRRLTVTDQLTYGVLHGDPAPDAFRIDPDTGRTGLVEWRAAATGPLVYDLAAAVGYAGGIGTATELIDGYLAAGPVSADEVESALPVLLRYRLAERAALDGSGR